MYTSYIYTEIKFPFIYKEVDVENRNLHFLVATSAKHQAVPLNRLRDDVGCQKIFAMRSGTTEPDSYYFSKSLVVSATYDKITLFKKWTRKWKLISLAYG
jgi:hypothetical protein